MNKKEECILVKELLPIYCDNATSEETKEVIENHLADCEECSTYKDELVHMKEQEGKEEEKIEEDKTEQVKEVSKKLRLKKYRSDLIYVLCLASFLIIYFSCFQMVEVYGVSMEPSYHDGQHLMMSKLAYHLHSPERGDVVSVTNDDMSLLKRVVGLPGETIEIKESAVFINGKKVEIKGQEGNIVEGEIDYPITLGKDEYFVMGDNVSVSYDSRYFGPVTKGDIRTKYLCNWFHF